MNGVVFQTSTAMTAYIDRVGIGDPGMRPVDQANARKISLITP